MFVVSSAAISPVSFYTRPNVVQGLVVPFNSSRTTAEDNFRTRKVLSRMLGTSMKFSEEYPFMPLLAKVQIE